MTSEFYLYTVWPLLLLFMILAKFIHFLRIIYETQQNSSIAMHPKLKCILFSVDGMMVIGIFRSFAINGEKFTNFHFTCLRTINRILGHCSHFNEFAMVRLYMTFVSSTDNDTMTDRLIIS